MRQQRTKRIVCYVCWVVVVAAAAFDESKGLEVEVVDERARFARWQDVFYEFGVSEG